MTTSRPVRRAVAAVCVLAQLVLGASALGLVVCTGRDHAAIELASDACCADHGRVGRDDDVALAEACCSDVPLFAAARRLTDLSRTFPPPVPVLVALAPPAPPPAFRPAGRPGLRGAAPAPAPRSVVLRV